MPVFSFEIARAGRPPLTIQTKHLEGVVAAWREVEALALALKKYTGASIRVRNAEGAIVILAGIATALATIKKYRGPEDAPLEGQGLTAFSQWRPAAP
ncbi:MAG TPA: hypothetical protein VMU18_05370 [Rhodoblastus sp.]|nr:hypothetical protein [Rhodoblastus sp.]